MRFVTAASLFDGHDAAINIMRRLLQAQGAEVVHLGHNRSVDEVVTAAVAEDVQGVAVSSYQGGHVEYFTLPGRPAARRGTRRRPGLRRGWRRHRPLRDRAARGLRRPQDLLAGRRSAARPGGHDQPPDRGVRSRSRGRAARRPRGRSISATARPWPGASPASRRERVGDGALADIAAAAASSPVPVLGITGTGGSGKSSLTDELIRRFRLDLGDKSAHRRPRRRPHPAPRGERCSATASG